MLTYFILVLCLSMSLADKPVLIDESKDVEKALGESIILSCSFESNSKLTISWLKDGNAIQFNNRIFSKSITSSMDSLNINKLSNGDAGVYSCVGTNQDGVEKGDIKVSLIEIAPKISPIENVYLREGQGINVTCSADAVPVATYSWSRIRNVKDDNVQFDGNRLEVANAVLANNGTYQCTARNSAGSRSLKVEIIIIGSTRWIARSPAEESVKVSEKEYELMVSFATTDTEKPRILWYKDSTQVSNDVGLLTVVNTQIGARHTSRLYFRKLSAANSGVYRVTVGLQMVSEFSHSMNLTVFSKPIISIDEGNEVFVEVGLSATFTCLVSALPQPKLQWKKNDTTLLSSDTAQKNVRIVGTRTTFLLRLSNVEMKDNGIYTCFGSNSIGTGLKHVKLSVVPARTPTEGESDETIIIVVVVVSVVLIFAIILAAFLYIKYRDRWCTNEYTQANGTFYTDLVQEEKDLSSLADIENNPYAIKKNINISIKRGNRSGTIGTKLQQDQNGMKGRSMKQSMKDRMSLKRPGASPGVPAESQYSRLGTVVCQGKAIDFKHIVFDECLGEGEYGLVNGGRVVDNDDATVFKEVSIKMLKDDFRAQDRRDMLAELRMMRRVSKHKNVILLIGWCITDDNVYVVEEYVPFGSVLTFLRAQRCLNQSQDALDQLPVEDRVDEKTLLSFGAQIASGMKHLEQLQVIHRDLACRNVFLGHEKTCKISEYGLVRDIYAENVYRKTTGGQLPVRWMAREAVFEGQYSHKSDIWSFGILLWELVTLGKIPYPGIVRTEHLLDELESGYHMENPGHISTEIYLLMSSCWNREPSTRPTFDALERKLTQLLNDNEEVHIDLPKLFENEMEDNEDFVRSPTGDFKRPQPRDLRERELGDHPEEEEEEEEEERQNTDPKIETTLNV